MCYLKSPIKYGDLRKSIKEFYKKNHIEKIEEIDFLIKEVLEKDELFFILNGEKALKKDEITKINEVLKKRKQKIPLPYILGYSYFWKSKFYVSEDILIPRKETEFLVEEGLFQIKEKFKNGLIIEPCIGSGSVLISLLKEVGKNFKGIGIDISGKAIEVAKKNVKLHKLENRIEFVKGDLLFPLKEEIVKGAVLIVVNPPYISDLEMKRVDIETKEYEPEIALYGGSDGLNFYRKIFSCLKDIKYLNPISFEIGYNQFEDVVNIGKEYGFLLKNFRKDFLGYKRSLTFRSQNG